MIESLSFDSHWFGLTIGRLLCPVDAAGLQLAEEADRFDLVYLTGRSFDVLPLGSIGGRVTLLDNRLDLIRTPQPETELSPNTTALVTSLDVEQAGIIAATAFVTARFFREDALRPRAGDLYRQWVANYYGVAAERGGILGYRESAGGDVRGFLVYRPEAADVTAPAGDLVRVDLIGVADGVRARGAGRALIEHLQSVFPGRGLCVRVSGDNPRALNFYLSAGFRPRISDVVVHRWRRP